MTPMNNSEQTKLRTEVDDDLDDFIDSLARQERKKPFDYDEWCREIDQHPAFMTVLQPDKNGEFSEPIQALQALKYEDDDLEDRRAIAEKHKIDGNKHFKYEKYHWAINRYTDGINQRCTDRLLNSILYANRAAAQKRLGNIGSAFRDCFFARKFDPENMKAIIRGAKCLVELGRGKQCMDWLKDIKDNCPRKKLIPYSTLSLNCESDYDCINELFNTALQLSITEERDERKRRQDAAKDLRAKERLLLAFKERNISFQPTICFDNPELFEWSQIEIQWAFLEESEKVYLDDFGVLHWPILVQYPETGKVDLITDCSEESTLDDVFSGVFKQKTSFDGSDFMFNAELMPRSKIREAFSIAGFIIMKGLPTIQIYTKKHAETNFVKVEDCFYKTK
uniref:Wheel domain-containing protein n=1 Tax=Elaeophora elaphi TaxID=1147741 RepID=A0A0R3S4L7_9BILA